MRVYIPNITTITPTIKKYEVIEILLNSGIYCVYVQQIMSVDCNSKKLKIKIAQHLDYSIIQHNYPNFNNGIIYVNFVPFHKHKHLINKKNDFIKTI